MPLFGKPDESKERFKQAEKYSKPWDLEFDLDRAHRLLEEAIALKPQEKKYQKGLEAVDLMKSQFIAHVEKIKGKPEEPTVLVCKVLQGIIRTGDEVQVGKKIDRVVGMQPLPYAIPGWVSQFILLNVGKEEVQSGDTISAVQETLSNQEIEERGKIEQLLGGLMTPNLTKGHRRGYGIYVTNKRIIGLKGGWKVSLGPGLGAVAGGFIGGAAWVNVGYEIGAKRVSKEAAKSIKEFEDKKEIDVKKEDLQQITLRKGGGIFGNWGHIIIQTNRDEYDIKILKEAGVGENEVPLLKHLFELFDSDKLVIEEQKKK